MSNKYYEDVLDEYEEDYYEEDDYDGEEDDVDFGPLYQFILSNAFANVVSAGFVVFMLLLILIESI